MDGVTSTILPSLVIHFVAYYLFVQWNYTIDIKTISILVSGTDDVSTVHHALESIQGNFSAVLNYFLVVNMLSFISGYLWKSIVRGYYLDSKFKILRFKNEWHYIFSGEILNFPKIPGQSRDIGFAYVDVVTEIDGEGYLYSGILMEYILSKEHILETICLANVRRRKISEEVQSENDYYYIPGNFIIFKYNHIQNLNITYYNWEEVGSNGEITQP